MSTKAMKLALDALEACINELVDEHNETDTDCTACRAVGQARKAIAALRQAIAQPETKTDRFLNMVRIWVERDGGNMDAALAWMYGDAQPAQVPAWQPIETAPKDFVTTFDGWNGERMTDVSWSHPDYSQKGHYDWCVSEYESHHGWNNVAVKGLTHWMPLPAAPEVK